jgi:hypothetical protein
MKASLLVMQIFLTLRDPGDGPTTQTSRAGDPLADFAPYTVWETDEGQSEDAVVKVVTVKHIGPKDPVPQVGGSRVS